MCFDYDGAPEVYNGRTLRSRKERKCRGCRAEIKPGDLYFRESGKFDGEFFDEEFCGQCRAGQELIHAEEIAEGCHESESWCAMPEVREWFVCARRVEDWPTKEAGQSCLAQKKTKEHA